MRVHVLGSGTSSGIPVIGCECSVCHSKDSRDKRTRTAIALENNGEFLLIDTPPELRLQLLRAGIKKIIGVIYTHLHADHTAGFDDLRAFTFKSEKPLPVYLLKEFEEEFRVRYAYAFNPGAYKGAVPKLDLFGISDGPLKVGSFDLEVFSLPHGSIKSLALKWNSFTYATDFKFIPEKIMDKLRTTVDVMLASGLHFGEHYSHSTINETMSIFSSLGISRGYISHLSHLVSHEKDTPKLQSGVSFAFDGMVIDL